MLTKRSRRRSLEYQNDCITPSTQKTLPCRFRNSRRASRSRLASPVANAAVTAARIRLGELPLAWAEAFVPKSKFDGVAVGGWTNIGASGYRFAYYQICSGNCGSFSSNHAATGSLPFGIQVYGYGSYTSYMYPGGLDLKR